MVKSAIQLTKYKNIKAKLKKDYPKGFQYTGVTLDLYYGGNKEVDISRIAIGGISSDKDLNNKLYDLILQGVEDNIKFWEEVVIRDIKELNESLKK